MSGPFIDLKCPHCDGNINEPPRHVKWCFVLGDRHRLLLCNECVYQIIGTVSVATVKEAIKKAIKVSQWAK